MEPLLIHPDPPAPEVAQALRDNEGSLFGAQYLPTTVSSYLRPNGIGVDRTFPFVDFPGPMDLQLHSSLRSTAQQPVQLAGRESPVTECLQPALGFAQAIFFAGIGLRSDQGMGETLL